MTIVGVARDTKHMDLRSPARPTLFTPLRQQKNVDQMYVYVRTATAPEQTFATIRQAMRQIDPGLAVDAMRTMQDQIETTLSNERMIELLAVSFGLLATLLAGVGLYGVLAYSTAQRTREIGIRMALGSSRMEDLAAGGDGCAAAGGDWCGGGDSLLGAVGEVIEEPVVWGFVG